MITAERKPLEEIKGLIGEARDVLVLGCGTCVTVCFAGGAREAAELGASLRMATRLAGDPRDVAEATIQRQCEWEYLDEARPDIEKAGVVVSLACGIGVQAIAERFPDARVVPGVNTTFLGMPTKHGIWEERCAACGECILGVTAGICPIARCAKSLLNGPCGGSEDGHCEVSADTPCAWQLIHDRLQRLGTLDVLMQPQPPKNWKASRDGGPRRIIRDDLRLAAEQE
jgi:ferredoxin